MEIALTGLMLLLGFMATLDWSGLKRRHLTKVEVETDPRFR